MQEISDLTKSFRKDGEAVVQFSSISDRFNEYSICWVGIENFDGAFGREKGLDIQPILSVDDLYSCQLFVVDYPFKSFKEACSWLSEVLIPLLDQSGIDV